MGRMPKQQRVVTSVLERCLPGVSEVDTTSIFEFVRGCRAARVSWPVGKLVTEVFWNSAAAAKRVRIDEDAVNPVGEEGNPPAEGYPPAVRGAILAGFALKRSGFPMRLTANPHLENEGLLLPSEDVMARAEADPTFQAWRRVHNAEPSDPVAYRELQVRLVHHLLAEVVDQTSIAMTQ